MTMILSISRQNLLNLGTLRTHSILVTCSKGEANANYPLDKLNEGVVAF